MGLLCVQAVLVAKSCPPLSSHLQPCVGLRPFHQKSTRITQSIVGPCVVQLWSGRGERTPRSPPSGVWGKIEPGRCRANMTRKTGKARFWPWLPGHFLWAKNRKIENPGDGDRGSLLKEPRPLLQRYFAHEKQLSQLGPPKGPTCSSLMRKRTRIGPYRSLCLGP